MSPLGRDPPNSIGRSPAINRCALMTTTFVILNAAIGLLVGCTLIAKLIASDDHSEPY